MTPRIRPAAPEDVPLLLALIGELAVYEHRADQAVATEALLAEHLFGPQPAAEALVAELDGEPAGFALFFPTFSTFTGRPGIWLEDIFVRPEARRRGVGRALLVHVARLALARDAGRFEWSVLDWNEPALALYRAVGAQPLDEWTTQRLDGAALRALAASSGD